MNIQLKHWQVTKIEMTSKSVDVFGGYTSSGDLELEIGNNFIDETNFDVIFKTNVCDEEFSLLIEARFDFEVDSPMTEEFILSQFPVVNAPAIAFPYLRAFISNLTLQSGIKPVILPSINFVEFAKQHS